MIYGPYTSSHISKILQAPDGTTLGIKSNTENFRGLSGLYISPLKNVSRDDFSNGSTLFHLLSREAPSHT